MKAQIKSRSARYRLVGFRITDREYAIGIEFIREIISYVRGRPLPDAPPFIEGVIDLRGKVIPTLNLRKKLGVPSSENGSPRHILIVSISGKLMGLVVDEVRQVFEVEEGEIQAPPAVSEGAVCRYLEGICKLNNQMVFIVSVEGFLSDPEKERLEDMSK